MLILAVVGLSGCAAGLRDEVRVAPEGVRFRLRKPDATSVAVVGDFNGWSDSSHPMTRTGEMWSSVIQLPPGEHIFMYVVDGTWVTPPNAAEVVPDGFGGFNGKVIVP
jgi:1,4-alpha-glucan branching enzyme